MRPKLISLTDAISTIPDGAIVALGGNTLHRGPCAAVHEIVRQGKRGLTVVKTAGAYDVDLLAGTGCAVAAACGFVGFETEFGMAPSYRRAVESGTMTAQEHACYTVIAGLRAAAQGVPFMPVAGMFGSDLIDARAFQVMVDPYSGANTIVVPRLRPDVAIVHVHEADELGNAVIEGTRFEDVLMAQAATRVIVTAERIVDGSSFAADPIRVAIPSFLVDHVVEATRGAWPLSCSGLYDADANYLHAYLHASRDEASLRAFVDDRIHAAAFA